MSSFRRSVIVAAVVPRPGVRFGKCLEIHLTAVCTSWRFIGVMVLVPALCGCGANAAVPGGGPFGAPAESRLLAPLAGHWDFDFEKTLDAQKGGRASEEQIDNLRKLYAGNPQLRKMHPDMTITGNEAVCSGTPTAEYRFFTMHEHAGKLCGKAWHHEDRFDPGDMSKCYVRLKHENDRLIFELRMQEVMDFDDRDLRATPPPETDSAAGCDAARPAGNNWSEWTTLVFVRRR